MNIEPENLRLAKEYFAEKHIVMGLTQKQQVGLMVRMLKENALLASDTKEDLVKVASILYPLANASAARQAFEKLKYLAASTTGKTAESLADKFAAEFD